MPVQLSQASSQDWKRWDAVFDSSFDAVCLFSFLGVILSLVFLLTVVPAFDDGLILTF